MAVCGEFDYAFCFRAMQIHPWISYSGVIVWIDVVHSYGWCHTHSPYQATSSNMD
jgi:hypothetical protein